MCDAEQRIRILILGGAAVGKTSIVKRFLFDTFTDKYKTTVEDLYNKEFDLGPTTIKVDIIDTCGDFQFPAMRRLSMATSHAFLFVYSTTSLDSFHIVKSCFEEFKENRCDYQDIPIVVVGNKVDLAPRFREVQLEDVSEWLYCEQPKLRVKLIECSAKDNYNIKEIFKHFLALSRILIETKDESSLKRRSSAYISATSKNSKASTSCNSLAVSEEISGIDYTASAGTSSSTDSLRVKPRSRSLIRRCSRKAKQQLRDSTQSGVDDCIIS